MQTTFVLDSLRWLALLHSGWVIGWLQGATRNGLRMFPKQLPRLRTPLLRDTVSNLRLNASAPMQPLPRATNADKWLQG